MDLDTVQRLFPRWAIWQGAKSTDGQPGDYYANRRAWSPGLTAVPDAVLTVAESDLETLVVRLKEQEAL